MRRLLSISAIAALLAPLVPVHIFMSCGASSQRMTCHRTAATAHHECGMMQKEMMHEEMADEDAEQSPAQGDSSRQITASDLSSTCPMNCCLQLNSGLGALAGNRYGHYQPVTIEYNFQPATVVFSANGFSSHTDRGPPLG